jgi:hypothetical protein
MTPCSRKHALHMRNRFLKDQINCVKGLKHGSRDFEILWLLAYLSSFIMTHANTRCLRCQVKRMRSIGAMVGRELRMSSRCDGPGAMTPPRNSANLKGGEAPPSLSLDRYSGSLLVLAGLFAIRVFNLSPAGCLLHSPSPCLRENHTHVRAHEGARARMGGRGRKRRKGGGCAAAATHPLVGEGAAVMACAAKERMYVPGRAPARGPGTRAGRRVRRT